MYEYMWILCALVVIIDGNVSMLMIKLTEQMPSSNRLARDKYCDWSKRSITRAWSNVLSPIPVGLCCFWLCSLKQCSNTINPNRSQRLALFALTRVSVWNSAVCCLQYGQFLLVYSLLSYCAFCAIASAQIQGIWVVHTSLYVWIS